MRNASFAVNRLAISQIIAALIAIKVVLLFVFAWHSRFVMDEFGQLGYAKYLGHALFETIWPPKAAGATSFYKVAHLVNGDARTILLIGRVQTALLACATLALIYGCARAIGHDRLRALLVLLVLLCFSNFIERSFRTIAEPLAVFFAAAALLVVLRGQADRTRTLIGVGILSGLSFLATQKALYFNVAIGLALVGDAALARHYRDSLTRGAWLVLGWTLPIVAYCLIFGGVHPFPVGKSLLLGPVEVATTGANAYANLRGYVWQTLLRNAPLYLFCFGGMLLELVRIRTIGSPRRIALIFTIVVTVFVFTHNQPWPYVFIMALPFMALWSPVPFDRMPADARHARLAWCALGLAVAVSFVRNAQFLKIGNAAQLDLVQRAQPLVGPRDTYFDGVGMLPNRAEPSTLWLDRTYVLKTLREKSDSAAYEIFSDHPPKLILWTTRMDAIEPVVGPLIRNSYVGVSPNLRLAGRLLRRDQPIRFDVPVAGSYALYDRNGAPLRDKVEIDGKTLAPPFHLVRGSRVVILRTGPRAAYLLPQGNYVGRLNPGRDNVRLFDRVYD